MACSPQKCKDLGFCRRNRNKPGPKFTVVADSVDVSGSVATATLLNADADKRFQLQLTAFASGYVRVLVTEPDVQRYRVRDVVLPEAEEKHANWQVASREAGKSITLSAGAASAVLAFQPFKLAINIDGKPAVVINSKGLFNVEHTRTKEQVRARRSAHLLRQWHLRR